MANHYGVLIPRIQPPDGALTFSDSDWEALRSLVAERRLIHASFPHFTTGLAGPPGSSFALPASSDTSRARTPTG